MDLFADRVVVRKWTNSSASADAGDFIFLKYPSLTDGFKSKDLVSERSKFSIEYHFFI